MRIELAQQCGIEWWQYLKIIIGCISLSLSMATWKENQVLKNDDTTFEIPKFKTVLTGIDSPLIMGQWLVTIIQSEIFFNLDK